MKKILAVVVFLSSCVNVKHTDTRSHFYSEEKCESSEVESINQKILNPVNLGIVDSLLYIIDNEKSGFLSLYDIRTNELITKSGMYGQGPDEFVKPLDVQLDKQGDLLILERRMLRVNKLVFNDSAKTYHLEKRLQLNRLVDRVAPLADGYFIGMGSFKEGLVSIYNEEGNSIGEYLDFPEEISMLDPNYRFMFAQGQVTSDCMSRFVVVSLYLDMISFCQFTQDDGFRVLNQYQYAEVSSPDYQKFKSASEGDLFYGSVCSDADFVYVLSLDFKRKDQVDNNAPCSILKFDWNGKPISRTYIDTVLSNIAYDSYNNRLIGITRDDDIRLIEFEL